MATRADEPESQHPLALGLERAQVLSLEEAAVHIDSLNARCRSLELELRSLAQAVDTLWTPPWKKLWFWVDGWPLYRVAERRQRRPWHRGH